MYFVFYLNIELIPLFRQRYENEQVKFDNVLFENRLISFNFIYLIPYFVLINFKNSFYKNLKQNLSASETIFHSFFCNHH